MSLKKTASESFTVSDRHKEMFRTGVLAYQVPDKSLYPRDGKLEKDEMKQVSTDLRKETDYVPQSSSSSMRKVEKETSSELKAENSVLKAITKYRKHIEEAKQKETGDVPKFIKYSLSDYEENILANGGKRKSEETLKKHFIEELKKGDKIKTEINDIVSDDSIVQERSSSLLKSHIEIPERHFESTKRLETIKDSAFRSEILASDSLIDEETTKYPLHIGITDKPSGLTLLEKEAPIFSNEAVDESITFKDKKKIMNGTRSEEEYSENGKICSRDEDKKYFPLKSAVRSCSIEKGTLDIMIARREQKRSSDLNLNKDVSGVDKGTVSDGELIPEGKAGSKEQEFSNVRKRMKVKTQVPAKMKVMTIYEAGKVKDRENLEQPKGKMAHSEESELLPQKDTAIKDIEYNGQHIRRDRDKSFGKDIPCTLSDRFMDEKVFDKTKTDEKFKKPVYLKEKGSSARDYTISEFYKPEEVKFLDYESSNYRTKEFDKEFEVKDTKKRSVAAKAAEKSDYDIRYKLDEKLLVSKHKLKDKIETDSALKDKYRQKIGFSGKIQATKVPKSKSDYNILYDEGKSKTKVLPDEKQLEKKTIDSSKIMCKDIQKIKSYDPKLLEIEKDVDSGIDEIISSTDSLSSKSYVNGKKSSIFEDSVWKNVHEKVIPPKSIKGKGVPLEECSGKTKHSVSLQKVGKEKEKRLILRKERVRDSESPSQLKMPPEVERQIVIDKRIAKDEKQPNASRLPFLWPEKSPSRLTQERKSFLPERGRDPINVESFVDFTRENSKHKFGYKIKPEGILVEQYSDLVQSLSVEGPRSVKSFETVKGGITVATDDPHQRFYVDDHVDEIRKDEGTKFGPTVSPRGSRKCEEGVIRKDTSMEKLKPSSRIMKKHEILEHVSDGIRKTVSSEGLDNEVKEEILRKLKDEGLHDVEKDDLRRVKKEDFQREEDDMHGKKERFHKKEDLHREKKYFDLEMPECKENTRLSKGVSYIKKKKDTERYGDDIKTPVSGTELGYKKKTRSEEIKEYNGDKTIALNLSKEKEHMRQNDILHDTDFKKGISRDLTNIGKHKAKVPIKKNSLQKMAKIDFSEAHKHAKKLDIEQDIDYKKQQVDSEEESYDQERDIFSGEDHHKKKVKDSQTWNKKEFLRDPGTSKTYFFKKPRVKKTITKESEGTLKNLVLLKTPLSEENVNSKDITAKKDCLKQIRSESHVDSPDEAILIIKRADKFKENKFDNTLDSPKDHKDTMLRFSGYKRGEVTDSPRKYEEKKQEKKEVIESEASDSPIPSSEQYERLHRPLSIEIFTGTFKERGVDEKPVPLLETKSENVLLSLSKKDLGSKKSIVTSRTSHPCESGEFEVGSTKVIKMEGKKQTKKYSERFKVEMVPEEENRDLHKHRKRKKYLKKNYLDVDRDLQKQLKTREIRYL
ncbi:uncharacterized protein LOC129217132 [Uloborus diversus]|uniref:uncharacterized protein LOC129217132 n=1 Tax=Uloborus diversus TaxID=327109 RepID=UPI0024096DB4|nr:uncharacterized protein LOC129217132 [Uloborus diversus]